MKIVIIGAGEVGFHIAGRLALENKDVVVVEKNPEGRHRLHAGDLVYFISEEKKLFGQLAVFGKHATPVRHVLIVGGGRIGYRLARRLEQRSLLRHIRRGKVLSSISLKGEEGEILEAVALPTSDIVSKPLKQISFPKGSMVAGILRKETVIIPDGDSVIEPEDRIIIFAVRKAVNDVEKILTVKLEFF